MVDRRFRVVVAIAVAAVAVCALVLWHSNAESAKPAPPVRVQANAPEANVPVDKAVVGAGNRLGIEVVKNLYGQSPNRNVFVSPAGLNMALTMTMNGASGDTRKAMAKALGLQSIDSRRVNKANAAMMANFGKPGPEVKISLANSLWLRKGVAFKPEFIRLNRGAFGARIESLKSGDPKAGAAAINSWVKQNTNGQIDQVIDKVDPDTAMILANVLHFAGTWTFKFDPNGTTPGKFTLPGGKQKHVQMMHKRSALFYTYRGRDFQAISLSYGPYGHLRFSMYIFLPDKPDGLNSFMKALTADKWNAWMAKFKEDEPELSLPRFQASYAADSEMKKVLTDVGMGIAFDLTKADFRNMTAERVWIGRALQKSVLRVDEQGTEASSASAIDFLLGIGEGRVVVDHPFFWAIRDNKTGQLLFAGVIVDPERL